jgi:arylsulfatase A-like enzyme
MQPGEIKQIGIRWQKDLESLRGVDDGVGAIVKALRRTGKLANTYIIFTSDNGQFNGEHRMGSAKFLPYEPATKMPLLIRGPGIRPRTQTGELSVNIDLAPTILSLTGASLPGGYDGRSLKPFWKNPKKRTRRPVVLEGFSGPNDVPQIPGTGDASASSPAPPRNFSGLRAGRYKYVEYTSGDRELYDLRSDPAELTNRAADPAWRQVLRRMTRELAARKDCRGSACRAQTTPLPAPPGAKKKRKAAVR